MQSERNARRVSLRILYHIPIAHCYVGLAYDEMVARGKNLAPTQKLAEKFWDILEEKILATLLNLGPFAVYLDSIYEEHPEQRINTIKYWASIGCRDARFTLELLKRGSRLEQAEDFAAWTTEDCAQSTKEEQYIQRDEYIAYQINKTLESKGLLLLGAGHDEWKTELNSDIEVRDGLKLLSVQDQQAIARLLDDIREISEQIRNA